MIARGRIYTYPLNVNILYTTGVCYVEFEIPARLRSSHDGLITLQYPQKKDVHSTRNDIVLRQGRAMVSPTSGN